MALSAQKIESIRSIGRTNTRRVNGMPAYPPYPNAILRNAISAMVFEMAMEGMMPALIQSLVDAERIGVFIHPKTADFLLMMLDVYLEELTVPMLRRRTLGGNASAPVEALRSFFRDPGLFYEEN